jgi:Ca2+-binding RTX toxin-like protein
MPPVPPLLRCLLLACALVALWAVPARASTLAVDGGTLTFTAPAGETNAVSVQPAEDGQMAISDPALAAAPAGVCTFDLPTRRAVCDAPTLLRVRAGDRDDTVTVADAVLVPADLGDGAGNDILRAGGGATTFLNDAGNDAFTAGAGGAGFVFGPGADSYTGGPGADTLSYAAAYAGVRVSLNGLADDGPSAEGDNAGIGIETITGSVYNDRLSGGAGAETLDGDRGNDILSGGAGPDVLIGGAGHDDADYSERTAPLILRADGRPGSGAAGEDDTIGDDVEGLGGGAGDDRLTGTPGADWLTGAAGNDRLDAGAGTDTMDGGAGIDTVLYETRSAPVTVTLLGSTADDGEAGERDSVRSAESVTGGTGNDRLAGTRAANVLEGGAGDDVITADAGDDVVDGGAGDDAALGADGADVLTGGTGADSLDGGAGNDRVSGGAGATCWPARTTRTPSTAAPTPTASTRVAARTS